jgi:hypothetical protein
MLPASFLLAAVFSEHIAITYPGAHQRLLPVACLPGTPARL